MRRTACRPMRLPWPPATSRAYPLQARSLWNHPWANGTRGEWRARRRWRWPSPEDGGGVSTRTRTRTQAQAQAQVAEGVLASGRKLGDGATVKSRPPAVKGRSGRRWMQMQTQGLPRHGAPEEHDPSEHAPEQHGHRPGHGREPEYEQAGAEPEYARGVPIVGSVALTVLTLALAFTLTLTPSPSLHPSLYPSPSPRPSPRPSPGPNPNPSPSQVAYIMLATAARRALTPVIAPSDVALSWFGSAEP